MPKKGKAEKKTKSKDDEKVHTQGPEYGPLMSSASIDSISGGKLRASRMGRTYELEVPRNAIAALTQLTMTVTEFEGITPSEFQLEGRIVSNRVEICPQGLCFSEAVSLRIPHFCGDKAIGLMYVAALHEALQEEEIVEVQRSRYTKLRGGSFDVEAGISSVQISQTGVFYVCSSLAEGIDYAVTKYAIPSIPKAAPVFHAVAFDWTPGEIHLWTRTSLDRPPAMDGPVYIRRKSRLKIEFEPRRDAGQDIKRFRTYEETFFLPGPVAKNMLTGATFDDRSADVEHGAENAFETLYIQTMMVPAEGMQQLITARAELQKSMEDVKIAEEQAMAIKRQLYDSERKAYIANIEKAKSALREAELKTFPWMDGSKAKEEEVNEKLENQSEIVATLDSITANEGLAGKTGQNTVSSNGKSSKIQNYDDLPTWTGTNMVLFFGAQFIPCRGFQEEYLQVDISIVEAERISQGMELLEVPEIPNPGCKPRKVWVGSPRSKLYTFAPLRTRASFAEFVVNVNIGAFRQKCMVNLVSDSQTLADIRKMVSCQCYGLDFSEARFMANHVKAVTLAEESLLKAQSLRPGVSFYGCSRRQGASKNHILLSFVNDNAEFVMQIYDNLKLRGFSVTMDQSKIALPDLMEPVLMVAFLSPSYNQDSYAHEQCSSATQKGLIFVPIWCEIFEPRGWMKLLLKDMKDPDIKSFAGKARLSGQQLDEVAMLLADRLPGHSAPVMFARRMPAPNSTDPPVSVPERNGALALKYQEATKGLKIVSDAKRAASKPSSAKKESRHQKK